MVDYSFFSTGACNLTSLVPWQIALLKSLWYAKRDIYIVKKIGTNYFY